MMITDRLTENFTVRALVGRHGVPESPAVQDNLRQLGTTLLQPFRDAWAAHVRQDNLGGSPVVVVASGYRPQAYNRSLGGAQFSRHLTGEAADVCADVDYLALRGGRGTDRDADRMQTFAVFAERWARSHSVCGGFGIYMEARTGQVYWVHLDIRPRVGDRIAVWTGHRHGSEPA